jgi:Chalcone isomerase-like
MRRLFSLSPERKVSMRRTPLRLILAVSLAALPALASTQPLQVEGATFDKSFYLVGHKVFLNGAGSGSLGDVKPFVAGLYLVKPARELTEAQASPGPKRLQLTLRQELDSKQLGNLLSQTLRANMSATELAACLPGLAKLGEMLGARKKLAAGDQLSLDGVMSQGTHVSVNGQKVLQIDGPVFFDCVLKGFLGPQPADAPLRTALLKSLPR